MLRGNRNFQSLFPEETPQLVPDDSPERKGRSEALILLRNELLICRYYYYTRLLGYQLPRTYKQLEIELHLTERTLQDLLQKNNLLLRHFFKSKPDIEKFRLKFGYMNWSLPGKRYN